MRHLVSSLLLAAALAGGLPLVGMVVSPTSVAAQDAFDAGGESAVLDRVNEVRQQAGAGPLLRDAALDSAARTHSLDMASADQLMHVSPTTGTPIDRVHAVGHSTGEVAENVAMHSGALEAQQALEASDAHLANMLNPRFTHVGIAVARDESGVYVTQVFARIEAPVAPAPSEPAAPSEPVVVAPPVAPVEAPGVVPQAPVPQVDAQIETPTAPAGQMGAPGQVITMRTEQGATTGFWVCGSARWWYYPLPAGTTAGQLQADLTVVGSPPGYGGCAPGASGAVAIGAPAAARPVGPTGGVYGAPASAYGTAPQAGGPVYSRPRVVVPGSVGPYYGAQPYGAQPYGAQPYGPQAYPQTYRPAPMYGPQPYGRRIIIRR